jgi:hypothetical protein
MHSRTRSLIATFTRTDTADWLVGIRRGPATVPTPRGAPDVERAINDSRTATVVVGTEHEVPMSEGDQGNSRKEMVCWIPLSSIGTQLTRAQQELGHGDSSGVFPAAGIDVAVDGNPVIPGEHSVPADGSMEAKSGTAPAVLGGHEGIATAQ